MQRHDHVAVVDLGLGSGRVVVRLLIVIVGQVGVVVDGAYLY